MSGSKCARCDAPLGSDDAFCGYCGVLVGTPPGPGPGSGIGARLADASPADQGLPPDYARSGSVLTQAPPAPADTSAPFFWHEPPQPARPLNNTTRYLCAAAYLSNTFANRVIGQLIATRRAVAPSVNMDLGPVIWHSRRARRNLMIRHCVLLSIIVIGSVISPLGGCAFFFYTFLLGWVVPRVHWKRRGLLMRILIVLLALYLGTGLITGIGLLTAIIILSSASASYGSGQSLPASLGSALSQAELVGAILVLLLLASWSTSAVFAYVTRRILVEELRPGAPPLPPRPAGVNERADIAEGAQWGNIALYATEDPFIGTGLELDVAETWSIAIRLDPADAASTVLGTRPAPGSFVRIDPVELHQAISERLTSLNDPSLAVNERIAHLRVSDRLVGSGVLRWDSPLVDKARNTPFSHASGEAIKAIIRHPQARLRYYQHVAISDEGPAVLAPDGRTVLDPADQGISISAFVYAAVEGRYFYLQFILTALPPVRREYRDIDLLPSLSSQATAWWLIWYSLKRFLQDTADCLPGLIAMFRTWRRERKTERRAVGTGGSMGDGLGTTAGGPGSVAGDLGAEVSVRELATADGFGSYIRLLDVEKYGKILDRAVLEAVQDFLASKGVDISDFSSSALNIINGDVIGVSGDHNQVGGHGSVFNSARAPGPR